MRIAMAQINPILGDLSGNIEKIRKYIDKAKKSYADLVIFPELAVSGYPPKDLLYETSFVEENKEAVFRIVEGETELALVIGFVDYDCEGKLYNAASIFKGNNLVKIVHKTLLPTYDVFDEDRYFKPSRKREIEPVSLTIGSRKTRLGVEICEDMWDKGYAMKVTELLAQKGSEIIVNISASPFFTGKRFEREKQLKEKAITNRIPFFYVNLVGGQDELIFDGQSLAVDSSGKIIAFAKQFKEDLVITEIDLDNSIAKAVKLTPYEKEQEMFDALTLGVRDYFRKTGYNKAIVGISGGIDSSLTTCIAVKALGRENVIGVSMPSNFSSEHSKTDAETIAKNLEICFVSFSIQNIVEIYSETLEKPLTEIREVFKIDKINDDSVADENIQPRARGTCLMDFSNRLKDLKILVLNTGNKTELALGYCTLYGDMVGGLGVLGDVSKLEVYELAEYANREAHREIIPRNVFIKKPSPELKENQYDPFNFDIVSPLVDEIIENHRGKRELIKMGYPKEIIEDVYSRIRKSEYKRRQAPPCLKITRQSFGIGWRMPIVNKYLEGEL